MGKKILENKRTLKMKISKIETTSIVLSNTEMMLLDTVLAKYLDCQDDEDGGSESTAYKFAAKLYQAI